MICKGVEKCAGGVALGRMDYQASLLVDDDNVIVFIDDFQGDWFGFDDLLLGSGKSISITSPVCIV